jgi:hypothetical protein
MAQAMKNMGYSCEPGLQAAVAPMTLFQVKNGKRIKHPLFAGVMFLHEDCSTVDIMHEALHAATTILRKHKYNIDLSRITHFREEMVAYLQMAIGNAIFESFTPKQMGTSHEFGDLQSIKDWIKFTLRNGKKIKT